MSRAYRPPIRRQGAVRPDRAGWRRARTVMFLGAGVLALGCLGVAGAYWWPGAPLAVRPAAPPTPVSVAASTPVLLGGDSMLSLPQATPTSDTNSRLAVVIDPASGADITLDVTFGQASETLHQSDLAPLVTSTDGGAELNVHALQALAARLADKWDQPMLNARFNFNGGDLTPIRDSQEGRTLNQAAAATAIGQALVTGQKSVALPGSVVPPQVDSANPQALGITTNLDRGSTSFAGSIPEKAHNIKLAAARLNGVVVPPGGTFSFNQEVGPTTLDAGFEWGFGIEASGTGARTVPSVAGGICQVATTLFQRAFWSGFPLVERHWHLYWIPAYTSRGMVGLDATVDEDSGLDLRWSNPTDGYVLIQSATDDSNVYFGLYGAKLNWKVSVDDPQISNQVKADPAPVAEAEPTLPWGRILPVEAARDGFDVSISRTVTRNDGQPRTLLLQSTYQPSQNVTLVGTKSKPAGADVDAVLARIAPPRQPTPSATSSASPTPVGTNEAVPGVSTLAGESPRATSTAAAASTRATAPPATAAAAASTPTQARTSVPATSTPVAAATRPPTSAPQPPTATPRPAATPAPNASPARR